MVKIFSQTLDEKAVAVAFRKVLEKIKNWQAAPDAKAEKLAREGRQMISGLTTEEHEVLANYHIHIIENYLHSIDQNISYVNKKPNIKFIENTIDAIKRELEIVKFYSNKNEKTNENKS